MEGASNSVGVYSKRQQMLALVLVVLLLHTYHICDFCLSAQRP